MEYFQCYDMMDMFRDCKSLLSLPDISRWNTYNVKFWLNIFDGCSKLSPKPKILKKGEGYSISFD